MDELQEMWVMMDNGACEQGFTDFSDMLDIRIKSFKDAIKMVKAFEDVLKNVNMLDKEDLQESIFEAVIFAVSVSGGFGNAPWIRKSGLMKSLDLDEVQMGALAAEFEGHKAWAQTYEGLSEIYDILDIIDMNAEATMKRICHEVRCVCEDWVDLDEVVCSASDYLEVLYQVNDVLDSMLDFYKAELHNSREVQYAYNMFCHK